MDYAHWNVMPGHQGVRNFNRTISSATEFALGNGESFTK